MPGCMKGGQMASQPQLCYKHCENHASFHSPAAKPEHFRINIPAILTKAAPLSLMVRVAGGRAASARPRAGTSSQGERIPPCSPAQCQCPRRSSVHACVRLCRGAQPMGARAYRALPGVTARSDGDNFRYGTAQLFPTLQPPSALLQAPRSSQPPSIPHRLFCLRPTEAHPARMRAGRASLPSRRASFPPGRPRAPPRAGAAAPQRPSEEGKRREAPPAPQPHAPRSATCGPPPARAPPAARREGGDGPAVGVGGGQRGAEGGGGGRAAQVPPLSAALPGAGPTRRAAARRGEQAGPPGAPRTGGRAAAAAVCPPPRPVPSPVTHPGGMRVLRRAAEVCGGIALFCVWFGFGLLFFSFPPPLRGEKKQTRPPNRAIPPPAPPPPGASRRAQPCVGPAAR